MPPRPRLPYAAKTLERQVRERKSRAKVEHEGEPDAFNVIRTLRFDKTTSKWLEPLLEVMNDPRIDAWHLTDAGYLHVTFQSDSRRADNRSDFDLDDAAALLR